MDDRLARRLAALRHSLESSSAIPEAPLSSATLNLVDEEDILTVRFEKIFNQQLKPKSNKILRSHAILEYQYNEDLSFQGLVDPPRSQKEMWAAEEPNEDEILELLSEANIALSFPGGSRSEETNGRDTGTVPYWFRDDTLEESKSDNDAEREILQIVKDELDFEAAHGIVYDGNDEQQSQGNEDYGIPKPHNVDFDEDLLKRFEALGGLELPPVPKIEPRRVVSTPDFEHETDTWCCICNEDAEYRCSGCEDDIYCARCLYEAHTGPDAGYSEQRHKWTKYIKPKRLATSQNP